MNRPPIDIDRLFHALGDPTRRAILDHLTSGPLSVSRLAEPLGITLTAVTQHLQILEEVGLLPASERWELAALIVAKYPLRTVEELVSRAEGEARAGKWVPTPPTADNIPTGDALTQGLLRAKKLGIAR